MYINLTELRTYPMLLYILLNWNVYTVVTREETRKFYLRNLEFPRIVIHNMGGALFVTEGN